MTDYDLSTYLCGQHMRKPVMNASGIFCFPDVLGEFLNCFGATMTKSIGPVERAGNQTPTNAENLNAMGLPNPGCEAFAKELEEAYPHFRQAGIRLYASVFGDSPEEVYQVTRAIIPYCNGIEVNISCPNLREGEKTGMTIGKDPVLAKEYVSAAKNGMDGRYCGILIAKQTPAAHISDRKLGIDVARACLEGGADVISGINTIPNAMDINIYSERPSLSTTYGGLSGKPVMPIGLAFVYSMYDEFGPDVPLIGMGGIETGEDVVKYVMAGANAVAIGTAFDGKSTEGVKEHVATIEEAIERILSEKKVKSLMELRGAAHER